MTSRRDFIKNTGLGLTGIVLGSSLLLNSCKVGCDQNDAPKILILPNEYAATYEGNYTTYSNDGKDHNIYLLQFSSKEKNLEEKSRIKGIITYLGPIKEEDPISIKDFDIKQKSQGGEGGFIGGGGDAKSIINIYDHNNIMMKIKTIQDCNIKEYFMDIKSKQKDISPGIGLHMYKQGDTISMPTIRCVGLNLFSDQKRYRSLNQVDILYLEDIRKE